MALTASLSIWSPIKIPFFMYNKKKETPSAPLVYSCKDFKLRNNNEERKPVQKMVNLRVPSYLNEIENSTPDLFFCILPGSDKRKKYRKCRSRPKTKQIIQMTIPNGFQFSRQEDLGDTFPYNYEKNVENSERSVMVNLCEDLIDFNFESFGELEDYDHIPSVKPWTQNELDEIKRIYSSLEQKIPKITKNKNRKIQRRGNNLIECKNKRANNKESPKKAFKRERIQLVLNLRVKEFSLKFLHKDPSFHSEESYHNLTVRTLKTSLDAVVYG